MDISVERLINSVEKRPYLWDKSNIGYKDKLKTNAGWKEVCAILKDDFDTLSELEQINYAKDVVKRWNNIRDSFRKYLKQIRIKKSGSGTSMKRKYVYYEQLLFLKKLFDAQMKESPPIPTKTEVEVDEVLKDSSTQKTVRNPVTTSILPQPPSKKKKLDEVEERMLQALEENENPHLLFCKGILPSIKDFDEDETIDFQMGVLHLIKSIRNRRPNTSFPSFSTSNVPCEVTYGNNNQEQDFYESSMVGYNSFPQKSSPESVSTKREEEEYLSSPCSSPMDSPPESKIFTDDLDFT